MIEINELKIRHLLEWAFSLGFMQETNRLFHLKRSIIVITVIPIGLNRDNKFRLNFR